MTEYKNLNDFLRKHLINANQNTGKETTHTAMSGGKYHIDISEHDTFFALYRSAAINGAALSITEKHLPFGSPLLFDLDFHYDIAASHVPEKYIEAAKSNTTSPEYITDKEVLDIIFPFEKMEELAIAIRDSIPWNIILPQTKFDLLHLSKIFIFHKKGPYIQKNKLKFGIHILLPNLHLSYDSIHHIYSKASRLLDALFKRWNLPVINSISDILDTAVIEKNNWLMLGSTKPKHPLYELKYIFFCNDFTAPNLIFVRVTPNYSAMTTENIALFSIRNIPQSSVIHAVPADAAKSNAVGPAKSGTGGATPITGSDTKVNSSNKCKLIEDFIDENTNTALYDIIDHLILELPQYELKPTKMKKVHKQEDPDDIIYFISTNDKYCYFKDKEHSRNSPTLFIQVNRKGILIKCYNQECHGRSYPMKPIKIPDDIYHHLFPMVSKSVNEKQYIATPEPATKNINTPTQQQSYVVQEPDSDDNEGSDGCDFDENHIHTSKSKLFDVNGNNPLDDLVVKPLNAAPNFDESIDVRDHHRARSRSPQLMDENVLQYLRASKNAAAGSSSSIMSSTSSIMSSTSSMLSSTSSILDESEAFDPFNNTYVTTASILSALADSAAANGGALTVSNGSSSNSSVGYVYQASNESDEVINNTVSNFLFSIKKIFPKNELKMTGTHQKIVDEKGKTRYYIDLADKYCPIQKITDESVDICGHIIPEGFQIMSRHGTSYGELFPVRPIPIDHTMMKILYVQCMINNTTIYNIDPDEKRLLEFIEDQDIITVDEDKKINVLILASLNATHYDIAKLVHELNKHNYRCVSKKTGEWYYWNDIRWKIGDGLLTQWMSETLTDYYIKARNLYRDKAGSKKDLEAKIKKIEDLISKLKNASFKNSVMEECCTIFYNQHPEFHESLDENTELIGFENGIYDLKQMVFRKGDPADNLTFTTKINYKPYTIGDNPDLEGFINQILPNTEKREYVLKFIASCLSGSITDEKFYIWTGSGGNGKSKFVDLIDKCFGEYSFKFPISFITQKRQASNQASPELAATKGKRFGTFQEPSENEKLNVGLMKELTGGDRITCRGLYKGQMEFKPQFKLVLCCNSLPEIPSQDGGTWRRLRVVEFTSRFVDDPDPNKPNEFKADKELSNKIVDWKEDFMGLLIEYYKKYKKEGLKEPAEVMKYTEEYKKDSDEFKQWFDDNYIITDNPDDYIVCAEIINDYKNEGNQKMNKTQFGLAIKKLLKTNSGTNVKRINGTMARVYVGIKRKNDVI